MSCMALISLTSAIHKTSVDSGCRRRKWVSAETNGFQSMAKGIISLLQSHHLISPSKPNSATTSTQTFVVAVAAGASVFVAGAPPFFNSSSIAPFSPSGLEVLAHRPLTNPSLPIKNFSKFHLILCNPMIPGLEDFIHSQTGSVEAPLTSVLPRTGKETP